MENSTGKTLLVFGIGIVAGAALGVLFAPRSGKETRAAIRGKGEELKEDLDELIEHGRKEWSKAKGKLADAATMTRDEVNDFVHYMFNEGKNMRSQAAAAERNAADRAKQTADDIKSHARHN